MAPKMLDGLWSIGVYPWKPEYQPAFVSPQDGDSSADTRTKHQTIHPQKNTQASHRFKSDKKHAPRRPREEEASSTSNTTKETSNNQSIAADVVEPMTNPPNLKKVEQGQTVVDLKETIMSLREQLLQAKTDAMTSKEKANDLNWKYKELTQDHTYNLQKLETQEKDIGDLNKRLDEEKDDVKYYRDKWEGDRSHTKECRRMEEKVDALQRENDSLRRQNPDCKRELEQSRRRIQELERRLGGATDRNDTYLKEMQEYDSWRTPITTYNDKYPSQL